jgi:hypothetical protein
VRKTIYTLNIDDYSPLIRRLTYPLFERYAKKIGADIVEITERRFPEWPVVYEKLQIYTMAQERQDEWSIYIDADAIVHPDFFDPTDHLSKDTVLHNGHDMAGNRWKYDRFFRRDGRHIGSCNWFTVASEWCVDLWRPLDDLTLEEAVANIFPIQGEQTTGLIEASHLIDDYTLSRNIAKYGLKFDCLIDMKKRLNDPADYLFHLYNIPETAKLQSMAAFLQAKGLMKMSPNY